MYSVFSEKRFVNNKGFIRYTCGEKYVATKEQAIKNANKKVEKFEADEKVFAYTVWIVEYEGNIESSEREIIGERKKVTPASDEEIEMLNQVRKNMNIVLK